MLLWISTGTTAPFSAMSGARITMSLVSTGAAILSCLSASATVFDSKAPLFQSASASPARSHPAAVAVAARAPVRFNAVLRESSTILAPRAGLGRSRPSLSVRGSVAYPKGPACSEALASRVDESPGLSAGFLDQAHRLDPHAPVDRLAHVVDRKEPHAHRGERFHLDAGAPDGLDGHGQGDSRLVVVGELGRDA